MVNGGSFMSKNTGMGRKRVAQKINKGMDKCETSGKQCGRAKKVSKGEHLKTMTDVFKKGEIS